MIKSTSKSKKPAVRNDNTTPLVLGKVSFEIFAHLSLYLDEKDFSALSRTCTVLRHHCNGRSWKNVLVVPDRSAIPIGERNKRIIPFKAIRAHATYRWIPFCYIENLELHPSTTNFSRPEYKKVFELSTMVYFNKEAYPALKSITVNLHYASTTEFCQSNWGKSLIKGGPGFPKLNIERPAIRAFEHYDMQFNNKYNEHAPSRRYLESLSNNFSRLNLSYHSSIYVFNRPEFFNMALPLLRSLTVTVGPTTEGGFLLNLRIRQFAPNLEELEIIWRLGDAQHPLANIPLTIRSLNRMKPRNYPKLRKCSLVIPSGCTSIPKLPPVPFSSPRNFTLNAPIVTHFVNRSCHLNFYDFYRFAKFPNLQTVSLVMGYYKAIAHVNGPIPYANRKKKWRFNNLEFVINHRIPLTHHCKALLNRLIISSSIKHVKVQVGSETMLSCPDLYQFPIPKTQETRDIQNVVKHFGKDYLKKTAGLIETLYKENVINRRQCLLGLEELDKILYEIVANLEPQQEISWDVYKDTLAYVLNAKYGYAQSESFVSNMYDDILLCVSKSQSVRYLHIDFKSHSHREYSPRLESIVKNPECCLKQVLMSFNIFHHEKETGSWKKDLPRVPYYCYTFNDKGVKRMTSVDACIDLENREVCGHYNESGVVYRRSLTDASPDFTGWF